MHAKKKADKQSAKFFADAGAYAPTIGIVGTVMSLDARSGNLANPDELGRMIAGGVPRDPVGRAVGQRDVAAHRQQAQADQRARATQMEIVIEGVAAIQAGSNPRIIAQKLTLAAPPPGSSPPRRRREMSRRKKHEEHEEHENHGWLVSYADMVTVLMALASS